MQKSLLNTFSSCKDDHQLLKCTRHKISKYYIQTEVKGKVRVNNKAEKNVHFTTEVDSGSYFLKVLKYKFTEGVMNCLMLTILNTQINLKRETQQSMTQRVGIIQTKETSIRVNIHPTCFKCSTKLQGGY